MSNISQSYFVEIIVVNEEARQIAIVTDSVDVESSIRRLAFSREKRARISEARRLGTFRATTNAEPLKVAYDGGELGSTSTYLRSSGFGIDNINHQIVAFSESECVNLIRYPDWIKDLADFLTPVTVTTGGILVGGVMQGILPTKKPVKSAWYWRYTTGTILEQIMIVSGYDDYNLTGNGTQNLFSIRVGDVQKAFIYVTLPSRRIPLIPNFDGDGALKLGWSGGESDDPSGRGVTRPFTWVDAPILTYNFYADVEVSPNTEYLFIADLKSAYSVDGSEPNSVPYINKTTHVIVEVVDVKTEYFKIEPSDSADYKKYTFSFNSGEGKTKVRIILHVVGSHAAVIVRDLVCCGKPVPVGAICDSGSTNLIKNSYFTNGVSEWLGYTAPVIKQTLPPFIVAAVVIGEVPYKDYLANAIIQDTPTLKGVYNALLISNDGINYEISEILIDNVLITQDREKLDSIDNLQINKMLAELTVFDNTLYATTSVPSLGINAPKRMWPIIKSSDGRRWTALDYPEVDDLTYNVFVGPFDTLPQEAWKNILGEPKVAFIAMQGVLPNGYIIRYNLNRNGSSYKHEDYSANLANYDIEILYSRNGQDWLTAKPPKVTQEGILNNPFCHATLIDGYYHLSIRSDITSPNAFVRTKDFINWESRSLVSENFQGSQVANITLDTKIISYQPYSDKVTTSVTQKKCLVPVFLLKTPVKTTEDFEFYFQGRIGARTYDETAYEKPNDDNYARYFNNTISYHNSIKAFTIVSELALNGEYRTSSWRVVPANLRSCLLDVKQGGYRSDRLLQMPIDLLVVYDRKMKTYGFKRMRFERLPSALLSELITLVDDSIVEKNDIQKAYIEYSAKFLSSEGAFSADPNNMRVPLYSQSFMAGGVMRSFKQEVLIKMLGESDYDTLSLTDLSDFEVTMSFINAVFANGDPSFNRVGDTVFISVSLPNKPESKIALGDGICILYWYSTNMIDWSFGSVSYGEKIVPNRNGKRITPVWPPVLVNGVYTCKCANELLAVIDYVYGTTSEYGPNCVFESIDLKKWSVRIPAFNNNRLSALKTTPDYQPPEFYNYYSYALGTSSSIVKVEPAEEDKYFNGTYYELTPSNNPLYWSSVNKSIVLSRDGAVEVRQKISGINKDATLYLSFDVVQYDPDYPEVTISYGVLNRSTRSINVQTGRPTKVNLALSAPSDGALEVFVRLLEKGDRVLLTNVLLCSTPAVPVGTTVQPGNIIAGDMFVQPVINCGLNYRTISFNPAATTGVPDWTGVSYSKALISYPLFSEDALTRTYSKLTPNDIFNLSLQVMDVGRVIITFELDGRRTVQEYTSADIGFTENYNLVSNVGSVEATRAGIISCACRVPKSGIVDVTIKTILDSKGVTFTPAPPSPDPYVPSQYERVTNGLFFDGVLGWYGGPNGTNAWTDPYPNDLWVNNITNNGRKHGGLYLYNKMPNEGERAVYEGTTFANQLITNLMKDEYYIITFRVDAPNVNAIGRVYLKVMNELYEVYPLYDNSVANDSYRVALDQYEVPVSQSNSTVYKGLLFGPIDTTGTAYVQFRVEITPFLKDLSYGVVVSEVSVVPARLIAPVTDLTTFDPTGTEPTGGGNDIGYYPFRIRWLRSCTYSSLQEKAVCGEGFELVSIDDFRTDGNGWICRSSKDNKLIKDFIDVSKGHMLLDKDQIITKLFTSLVPRRDLKIAFDSLDAKPFKISIKDDQRVLAEGYSDPKIGRIEFTTQVPSQGYAIVSLEQAADLKYASTDGVSNSKKTTASTNPDNSVTLSAEYKSEILYQNYDPNKIQKIRIYNKLNWKQLGLTSIYTDVYGSEIYATSVKLEVELIQGDRVLKCGSFTQNPTFDEAYAEKNNTTLRNPFILTSDGFIDIYIIKSWSTPAGPQNIACVKDGAGYRCVPDLNQPNSNYFIDRNPTGYVGSTQYQELDYRKGDSIYFYQDIQSSLSPNADTPAVLSPGQVTLRVTKTVHTPNLDRRRYYLLQPEVVFRKDDFTSFCNISMEALNPPDLSGTKVRIANLATCMSKENIVTDDLPLTNLRITVKWNGMPRSPVNLFNQFVRLVLRMKDAPYDRTILNILPTQDGHTSTNLKSTCNYWKQNGNSNVIESNILAKGIIGIDSILPGDYQDVSRKINHIWSIPTLSDERKQDLFIITYDIPETSDILESISVLTLANIIESRNEVTASDGACSPDPATDFNLSIEYKRSGASKAFDDLVQVSDLYRQIGENEGWDAQTIIGGGVKGSVAQWIESTFVLDKLDGGGLDQQSAPVTLVFSGRSKRRPNMAG